LGAGSVAAIFAALLPLKTFRFETPANPLVLTQSDENEKILDKFVLTGHLQLSLMNQINKKKMTTYYS
jgi:hypothetical protein